MGISVSGSLNFICKLLAYNSASLLSDCCFNKDVLSRKITILHHP